MLYKKISKENIIKYFILLIVLKIFPLISLYNNDKIYINYIDVYSTFYLYLIYMLIFFIIYDIILEKNINVISDTVNKDLKTNITDNKDTSLMSSIYDTTYNDIIKQII
jgi:predicted histidine transporter YuiF (NhaC family)